MAPPPKLVLRADGSCCLCVGGQCLGCPPPAKKLRITDVMTLQEEKVLKYLAVFLFYQVLNLPVFQFDEIPSSCDQAAQPKNFTCLLDTRRPSLVCEGVVPCPDLGDLSPSPDLSKPLTSAQESMSSESLDFDQVMKCLLTS